MFKHFKVVKGFNTFKTLRMFKQNFKDFDKILMILKVQMVWKSPGAFPRRFKFPKVF